MMSFSTKAFVFGVGDDRVRTLSRVKRVIGHASGMQSYYRGEDFGMLLGTVC